MCLTKVGQHQVAHVRCCPCRLHGFGQSLVRTCAFGKFFHGHFQITNYHAKPIIEVMGNGCGHASKAFGLLELQVLFLHHFFISFRLLAAGDVSGYPLYRIRHSLVQDTGGDGLYVNTITVLSFHLIPGYILLKPVVQNLLQRLKGAGHLIITQ